ncbi:hypothetical protein EDD85DRAFT_956942 [Armillaria nabsnona]|nr:hypothetical protein EDD85DRAFT_956942 [Armillaria nabsnona]
MNSRLIAAALVLAIQFYCRKPQTYINQQNINPIINYVLPQQPPMARIHAPIHDHESTEIHELPHLSSQREENMEPLSLSSPPPALSSMLFQVVQRGIRRPPTPHPAAASNSTRDNNTAAAPAAFDPDAFWDTITPSAFLSISAFIPPREQTPEIHVEDPEYLSILNWDQPVPDSQYEWIPFNESGALSPTARNQPLNLSPGHPNPRDDISSSLKELRSGEDPEISGQVKP